MTTLQKNEYKIICMTKCEEIFQKLKWLLTTTPIQRIVNHDGDFVVCTDASKEGVGEFLMQNDCTICYESQKLKENEKNYPPHDLELESIIHALNRWRH